MPLSKQNALDFLREAQEHEQNIGSAYSIWSVGEQNIQERKIVPFIFEGDEGNKSLGQVINEIEQAEFFDTESDEAKWIEKFLARKEMIATGKRTTFLSNLERDMSKVQDFFSEDGKKYPDMLSPVRVGLKEYQVNPDSLFYAGPFFPGDDTSIREEKLERIQTVLNELFETSVCLDMFFDNDCHYMPREECMQRYVEPLKDSQRKQLVALMSLHGAGLVKPQENAPHNTQRFFKISEQLPQDVRENIAQKVTGSKKTLVTEKDLKQKAAEELNKMGPGQS